MPSSSPNRFAKILDLATHNALVAVATVLTIVTGVAFVISSLTSSGSAVTNEMLLAALKAAEAEAVEATPEGAMVKVADGSFVLAPSAEEQVESLRSLQGAAAEESATEEERTRILDALTQAATGNVEPSIKELGEIGRKQESRGALDVAGETWRRRATLLRMIRPIESLDDLLRAERLSPGDFEQLYELGVAIHSFGNIDDSVAIFRKAAARAEADGEPRNRALADAQYACSSPSWRRDEDFLKSQIEVLESALPVLLEWIEDDPWDLEPAMLVRRLAASVHEAYVQEQPTEKVSLADAIRSLQRARTMLQAELGGSRRTEAAKILGVNAVCTFTLLRTAQLSSCPDGGRTRAEVIAEATLYFKMYIEDDGLTSSDIYRNTAHISGLISNISSDPEFYSELVELSRLHFTVGRKIADEGFLSSTELTLLAISAAVVGVDDLNNGNPEAGLALLDEAGQMAERVRHLGSDELDSAHMQMATYFVVGKMGEPEPHPRSVEYLRKALAIYEADLEGTRLHVPFVPVAKLKELIASYEAIEAAAEPVPSLAD